MGLQLVIKLPDVECVRCRKRTPPTGTHIDIFDTGQGDVFFRAPAGWTDFQINPSGMPPIRAFACGSCCAELYKNRPAAAVVQKDPT